ncbi:hypothetical protein D3C72_2193340 [compost metagenome]
MGNDFRTDVCLPDANYGPPIARSIYQSLRDGEQADGRGEVAAVARPVDYRAINGNLAKTVVDITVFTF